MLLNILFIPSKSHSEPEEARNSSYGCCKKPEKYNLVHIGRMLRHEGWRKNGSDLKDGGRMALTSSEDIAEDFTNKVIIK